jgi:ISXO2-like transposase domain
MLTSKKWMSALHDRDFRQLIGIVEVDEACLGGKRGNRHKNIRFTGERSTGGKIPIIGAIARKGAPFAKLSRMPTRAHWITSCATPSIVSGSNWSRPMSHSGYRFLSEGGKDFALPHQIIRHSTGEYVRGVVHANSIVSFCSLLKGGIVGTYHICEQEVSAIVPGRISVQI